MRGKNPPTGQGSPRFLPSPCTAPKSHAEPKANKGSGVAQALPCLQSKAAHAQLLLSNLCSHHGACFVSGRLPQPQRGARWVLGAVGRARSRLPVQNQPSLSPQPCQKAAWQPTEELVASAPAKGGTFASRPGCAMHKSGSSPLRVDSSANSPWSLALEKVPQLKSIIFSLPGGGRACHP